MTTTHNTLGEERPVVGQIIEMPVVPSQTRTSYFPDLGSVFGRNDGQLEIVLLRQEVQLIAQTGVVKSDEGSSVTMEFRPTSVSSQMQDIAHIRMSVPSATDMALGILSIALSEGAELEALVNRLQTSNVQST